MFGNHKEARGQKKNKDVTELLDLQKTYLKQIDEKFIAVENITDPAEKIPMLYELIRDVARANQQAHQRQQAIVEHRTNKKALGAAGVGAIAGAAALAVPVAILCPPIFLMFAVDTAAFGGGAAIISSLSRGKKTQRKRLLKKNPSINNFDETVKIQVTRAKEMLSTAYADLQKDYFKQVDEKFVEVEKTNDPAKKILMLQELMNDRREGRLLLEKNRGPNDFAETMALKTAQAEERIAEIIKTCSLEIISLSPSFEEAFDNFQPLRDRFKKAAIETTRQAHDGKAATQQPAKRLKVLKGP